MTMTIFATAASRSRPDHPRRGWLVLPLGLLLAGCGAAAESPPLTELRELASPAGSGSGEVHLEADGEDVVMSWLEPAGDDATGDAWVMRMARLRGDAWQEPATVTRSERFFVNWADFPSVTPLGDGRLAAHWLERGPAGGYDYGVRVSWSEDGGRSWSEPWTPHEDGTPQEHGFVTLVPMDGGATGLVWLDGRDYEAHARAGEDADRAGADGNGSGTDGGELVPSATGPQMALRFRVAGPTGEPRGPSVALDPRACDCCQTDIARTAGGLLVVYRDRSQDEIRDISAIRFDGSSWSDPAPVHQDGWEIGGCPVNGPAVSASGDDAVVAWFTAAADVPRVRVAFTADGGRTFAPPVEVDEGNPAGRVDVELLDDGSALVAWLERAGGEGEEDARILVRRVAPDGAGGPSAEVTTSSASRASGFPQLVRDGSDGVIVAWTDVAAERVRVARARIAP